MTCADDRGCDPGGPGVVPVGGGTGRGEVLVDTGPAGNDHGPMRTADESQSPDDGGATQIGDGYKLNAEDLTDGFGDELDDDGTSRGDEGTETSGDADGSDGTDVSFDELGLDEESVANLSESEAEDVLVEVVEQEGFSSGEAQDIVDDLQEDTGLSAGELLEDYVDYYESTGDDPLGVDGGGGAGGLGGTDPLIEDEPFEPLDRPSHSDLNQDGRVTPADAHEAQSSFDFDFGG